MVGRSPPCVDHSEERSCSDSRLLVAADIVKTVTSAPSLTDAAVLGVIVLIRTVLSLSIEIEIDGVAPWRKAFVTGPQVLAHATRQSTRSQTRPTSEDPKFTPGLLAIAAVAESRGWEECGEVVVHPGQPRGEHLMVVRLGPVPDAFDQ